MDFFELDFEKVPPGRSQEPHVVMSSGSSGKRHEEEARQSLNQCRDYNMIGTYGRELYVWVCVCMYSYKVAATKKLPSNSKAGFSNKEECMSRIRYWLCENNVCNSEMRKRTKFLKLKNSSLVKEVFSSKLLENVCV